MVWVNYTQKGVDFLRIDKDIVKELYLKGYNAAEISISIDSNTEAIRKCIQRNFSHLKLKHEIAIIQKKEAIKAINYEASKYISDKSFILKNRSIYRTKINGDIVLNRAVAPVVTWDTPKTLINENKVTS